MYTDPEIIQAGRNCRGWRLCYLVSAVDLAARLTATGIVCSQVYISQLEHGRRPSSTRIIPFFLALQAPPAGLVKLGVRATLPRAERSMLLTFPPAPYSARGYDALVTRAHDLAHWALPLEPFSGGPWETAEDRLARLKALDPQWGGAAWRQRVAALTGNPHDDFGFGRLPAPHVDHMLRPIKAPPAWPALPERFTFWLEHVKAPEGF